MYDTVAMSQILNASNVDPDLRAIADKVDKGERLNFDEGVILYKKADLPFLGGLANAVRERKYGDTTFFNKNFHIEPTNLCVFDCKFCSYSRMLKDKDDGWFMSDEEILNIIRSYHGTNVTEVHIVGGVHPRLTLQKFAEILQMIKNEAPNLHIKALTAVELEYMIRKAKMTYPEGLQYLREHGLDSVPGGGAEIFDEEIREIICAEKATTDQWLNLHESAHNIGMHSNCTMLYGHIEKYEHRIDHMKRLRDLQDRTGGFNAFIPLKFRNEDNQMEEVEEATVIEDLKNYAVARILLDNIPHIKAYWPMIGRSTAQLSLAFGVDDLDGTIDDSTSIYSMAGAEEQNPAMTSEDIIKLIKEAGRHPVERDTLYNTINDYGHYELEDEGARAY
jgi:aminodeoxyfutalosine synthase